MSVRRGFPERLAALADLAGHAGRAQPRMVARERSRNVMVLFLTSLPRMVLSLTWALVMSVTATAGHARTATPTSATTTASFKGLLSSFTSLVRLNNERLPIGQAARGACRRHDDAVAAPRLLPAPIWTSIESGCHSNRSWPVYQALRRGCMFTTRVAARGRKAAWRSRSACSVPGRGPPADLEPAVTARESPSLLTLILGALGAGGAFGAGGAATGAEAAAGIATNVALTAIRQSTWPSV